MSVKSDEEQTRKGIERSLTIHYILSIFFAISLPLGYTIITTVFNVYKQDDWCRLYQKSSMALYYYYIPVLLAMVFNVFMLFAINKVNQKMRRDKLSLVWWIPSFCFVWIVPIINSIFRSATGGTLFPLVLIGSITNPLQGFINSLLFSYILFFKKRPDEDQVLLMDKDINFKKYVCYLFGNRFEWLIQQDNR